MVNIVHQFLFTVSHYLKVDGVQSSDMQVYEMASYSNAFFPELDESCSRERKSF